MPFYWTDKIIELSYPKSKNLIKKISLPNAEQSRINFLTPRGNTPKSNRRVAFRTLRKGSFIVEAAGTVPFFFLIIVVLIGLMNVYGIYVKNMVQLQEEVEKEGMYSAIHSTEEEVFVDRQKTTNYRPDWLPALFPGVKIACRGRVRAWTGRTAKETDRDLWDEKNKLVYVTEHESVYHTTSRCSHLSLSICQVSFFSIKHLRNKEGKRYQACDKCVGSGGKYPGVYITEQGDCYHNSLECSGLTRNVRLERLNSLGNLECCIRCKQLEED